MIEVTCFECGEKMALQWLRANSHEPDGAATGQPESHLHVGGGAARHSERSPPHPVRYVC